MKSRFSLPGFFILVFIVAACTPPNLRNEKFLHDNSLFEVDENCTAPCWMGITPGVTEWSDALTIVEDLPNVDAPQTQTAEDGPAIGALWKETNGDDCCQMVTTDGETVSWILLQLAPTRTLKELIDAQGEPTYVVGTPGNEEQAVINLFYPEKGLVVFIFVAGAAEGRLSDSSEVIGAYFLEPEGMETILTQSNLYAWDGYQSFSAYAPDAEGADFAITAIPTGEATSEPESTEEVGEEATQEATAEATPSE